MLRILVPFFHFVSKMTKSGVFTKSSLVGIWLSSLALVTSPVITNGYIVVPAQIVHQQCESRRIFINHPPSSTTIFRARKRRQPFRRGLVPTAINSRGDTFTRKDASTRISLRMAGSDITSSTSTHDDDDDQEEEEEKNYNWTSQNFELAVPALIGMLADPLLSLMDTAYVGRVGSLELAALGACTSIFHLAFNAFRATVS